MMALVVFWACTPSVPSRYIQPDEMEDILYDYHLAQAMAQKDKNYQEGQKNRTKYFYAVLAKYDVTEADFDSSMVYYYSDIPQLQKIYSAVEERMDNEASHIGATIVERESTTSLNGDTANVWKEATAAVLMPVAPYNRIDFSLKVDTSFHKGDEFQLTFNTDYLYQSGTKDAVIYAAVTFDNDSTAQYYTHVSSSGQSQLRIPSNFNNAIRKFTGFIYLSRGSDDSNTLKLMFIDKIRLLRFHKKENPKPASPTPSMPTPSTTDTVKGKPNASPLMPNETPQMQKGAPQMQKGIPPTPIKPIQRNVR